MLFVSCRIHSVSILRDEFVRRLPIHFHVVVLYVFLQLQVVGVTLMHLLSCI